jgi:hypothetical protein
MTTRAQTAHLKSAFIDAMAEYGNVSTAARIAGCDRRTVYKWQEYDDEFAAAFREAELTATETLEAEARRRAVEGVTTETPIIRDGRVIDTIVETKYSDTLLIFLLKARAPEKYRERFETSITSPNGQPPRFEVIYTDTAALPPASALNAASGQS